MSSTLAKETRILTARGFLVCIHPKVLPTNVKSTVCIAVCTASNATGEILPFNAALPTSVTAIAHVE